MVDFSSVNPNILYVGFIVLVVLAGIGEYFHVVPTGTAAVLIGGVFGGATAHASIAMGARAQSNVNAAQVQAAQAQAQAAQTQQNASSNAAPPVPPAV